MARNLNEINASGELTSNPQIDSAGAGDKLLKQSESDARIPTVTATYDIKAKDSGITWISAPNM